MNKSSILSICNESNRVGMCYYDGNKYRIFAPFYDYFTLSKALKIIDECFPDIIIASVSEVFQEMLKSKYAEKVIYMHTRSKNIAFKDIDKLENATIRLLSSFTNHYPLVGVEGDKIVGYAGEYIIEKVNAGAFFIDNSVISNITDFKRLNLIVKNAITRFGRCTLVRWISQPLISEQEVAERRSKIEYMVCKVPKLLKLLRKCKINCFDQKINFSKLKLFIKSALIIQKLLHEKLALPNRKRYLKLYKILRIFDKNGISNGKDRKLDELRSFIDKIPLILENTTRKLSQKYQIPISSVYIPGAGFFIESGQSLQDTIFTVKDKFYCKNEDMKNLDAKIGDPYERINAREIEISIRVIEKIHKTKLSPLYDFIGEVDSCISLYLNTNGSFTECCSSSTFEYQNISFHKTSVLLGGFNTIDLIESIIINQIGGCVDQSSARYPLFKRLAFKIQNEKHASVHNSAFQNEVIQLSKIFRHSDENTLCLLEGIAESTTPTEGLDIFSSFIQKITARFLIISTSYELCDLKNIKNLVSVHFYQLKDGKPHLLDGKAELDCEQSGICDEFEEYIQMTSHQ
ncbi:uncharacterized protein VICG_00104 [Vittaforma corneae ATCC 50505]|uniref:DNA mismatch repair proteins mutS family domain-containing protein n=1 Tax=Vittaforma corneae (strain ATCC 50505) TaxID=993615 RepID=L2GQ96_VITCO|nr:uncharacterized protein VICG_00104 [Vittaforma corneae ATCC 50505]ELA42789.1 hypothetical protein VICG_00104 [Vittaforma corneae ATCC 50505]